MKNRATWTYHAVHYLLRHPITQEQSLDGASDARGVPQKWNICSTIVNHRSWKTSHDAKLTPSLQKRRNLPTNQEEHRLTSIRSLIRTYVINHPKAIIPTLINYPNQMFQIFAGIFSLGTSVWDHFAWEIRSGSSTLQLLIGNVFLRSLTWAFALN